jgi:hypothetical protein
MIAHFLSLVQAPQEKEQPQYSWNIVESGAKHHNPDHPTLSIKSEGHLSFHDTPLNIISIVI